MLVPVLDDGGKVVGRWLGASDGVKLGELNTDGLNDGVLLGTSVSANNGCTDTERRFQSVLCATTDSN